MSTRVKSVIKFSQRWLITSLDHSTNSQSLHLIQTRVELQELALVEVDLSNLERMVEELAQRLNVKIEHKYRSTSSIRKTSRQLSNQERKMYVYRISFHNLTFFH